jgi:hypothetical protein
VFRLFQLQIGALRRDRGLTPGQKAAAIAALRMRQLMEAKGARNRVTDEERQIRKERRRLEKALLTKLTPP